MVDDPVLRTHAIHLAVFLLGFCLSLWAGMRWPRFLNPQIAAAARMFVRLRSRLNRKDI